MARPTFAHKSLTVRQVARALTRSAAAGQTRDATAKSLTRPR